MGGGSAQCAPAVKNSDTLATLSIYRGSSRRRIRGLGAVFQLLVTLTFPARDSIQQSPAIPRSGTAAVSNLAERLCRPLDRVLWRTSIALRINYPAARIFVLDCVSGTDKLGRSIVVSK